MGSCFSKPAPLVEGHGTGTGKQEPAPWPTAGRFCLMWYLLHICGLLIPGMCLAVATERKTSPVPDQKEPSSVELPADVAAWSAADVQKWAFSLGFPRASIAALQVSARWQVLVRKHEQHRNSCSSSWKGSC